MVGDRDNRTPPRFSRPLHFEILNSKLVIVEDAGQCVAFERPNVVNTEITKFLKDLGYCVDGRIRLEFIHQRIHFKLLPFKERGGIGKKGDPPPLLLKAENARVDAQAQVDGLFAIRLG